MLLEFETIKYFEDHFNITYTYDKCSCDGLREMKLSNATVIIDEHEIFIVDCPVLVCQKCGTEKLGNLVPQEIYTTYFKMQENGALGCRITSLNNKRFKYAEKADFNYDCRDLNIPGLHSECDMDHPDHGFSCPVYFDRKVLNNFLLDNDYELNIFSESYGDIAKIGTYGWQWEWKIAFGINLNNKVIMFLGDLDQIDADDRAILWLKSYNIESDHIIVNTELYQAQLNCFFSKPIIEERILTLRNSFFSNIKTKYKISLFHLEAEVEILAQSIKKPVNYSESELKENIVAFDGLLNEGIACNELRKLYVKCVNPLPSNYIGLKTRKLLEGIITAHTDDIEFSKDIVSPLYYLNDLRVCFAHLLPQEKVDSDKQKIVNAFNLSCFTEYRKLYDTLMDKLYRFYQYLNNEDF
ncbi:hypothetical protein K2F40_15550 [Clostridium sp. CM028]|uniref:hypothetical protein n=1 Tax=Clostridium sp. CM028 TaxID=2851575 RepID=UPI001C6E750F|nr:hypothetical protein [Clostridium sp. CM028]MBW9150374.1 hypothetical protein [Clostridium sp. CM028]WLC63548.1 hypothetical protein KTC94_17370 [Clostridium sp. CM028]